MDKNLKELVDAYLDRLGELIRRGRELRDALVTEPPNTSEVAATRAWQEECGATIHELSAGIKAHWLARSFSEAFLVRSAAGQVVEGAAPEKIVERLLGVLQQAVDSLSRTDLAAILSLAREPEPRRFEFVHNAELRPVVEQAYRDSRRAIEQKNYDEAMRTTCGVLEAIVTDALEHTELNALATSGAPGGKIGDWSFETRLAVAEQAGLIRGGCARLPAVARTYRDQSAASPKAPISERDARLAGQVLHVVMRDLNPGR